MHAAEGDVKFVPYEKMGDSTASWQSKKLDLIKKWVATEKVHGANFSFTVFEDGTGQLRLVRETPPPHVLSCLNPSVGTVVVKVAKRSGFLTQTDNFFGVYQQPRLIDDECDKARCLYRAIGKKSSIRSITIYGELFGGIVGSSLVSMTLYCLRWVAHTSDKNNEIHGARPQMPPVAERCN